LLGGAPRHDKAAKQAALDNAIALHESGELDSAAAAYDRLLAQDPKCSEAIHLLGLISHQRGNHAGALQQIDRAIAIDDTVALYHCNRANVLIALGRMAEACAGFDAALRLKPDYTAARYNHAKALAQLQRHDEAIAAFRAVPADLPGRVHDYASALLGAADSALSKDALLDEAITLLQPSWPGAPDPVEARIALASALQQRKRLSEAVAHYEGALADRPDSAKAHNNLANCYNQLGRIGEAIVHYRRLHAIAPDFPDALTSVLANLNYDVQATAQQVFDEHRAWARAVAAPLYPAAPHFDNTPDAARALRVGFVSPDLRRHPVSNIFAPILAAFDRARIESYCYYNLAAKDAVTAHLAGHSMHWRDVASLSDAQLHQAIRDDGIDILVDLAGHTIHNRLAVFARRAAPVQVSWLGYFNTTGLDSMDYFISDPHSSPPGQERYYSETLLRLPDTRFCYAPPEFMPAVNALPALHQGRISFGCCNNLSKLNQRVLGLWARILAAVPRSRLILQAAALDDAPNRRRFSQLAQQAGIAAAQLELRGFAPVEVAPRAYHDIDIALDPFPFCGGMTSFEALWMGVPVVTLDQPMIAGRQTISMLANLGLADLVAADEDAYFAIAVRLAQDPQKLEALRQGLRPRFAASPLQDYARFTRALEDAFGAMWRTWIAGGTRPSSDKA